METDRQYPGDYVFIFVIFEDVIPKIHLQKTQYGPYFTPNKSRKTVLSKYNVKKPESIKSSYKFEAFDTHSKFLK